MTFDPVKRCYVRPPMSHAEHAALGMTIVSGILWGFILAGAFR